MRTAQRGHRAQHSRRWVERTSDAESPGGTIEPERYGGIRSSLRDWMRYLETPVPAINRWAILKRPSGTGTDGLT